MPTEPVVTRTECAQTHTHIQEWQQAHYEHHLKQAEVLGNINTTLLIMAKNIEELKAGQEGLKKFQWKASGVYLGITIVLSALVSMGAFYMGFKRMESDYVKKSQVPFYEMIETMNIKSAGAAELPEGVVEIDDKDTEKKAQ